MYFLRTYIKYLNVTLRTELGSSCEGEELDIAIKEMLYCIFVFYCIYLNIKFKAYKLSTVHTVII